METEEFLDSGEDWHHYFEVAEMLSQEEVNEKTRS